MTITHYQYVNVSCLHGFVLQSLLNHFHLYLLTASYILNFLPIHVRPCSQSTVSNEINGRSAFKCCTSQLVKLYRDDTVCWVVKIYIQYWVRISKFIALLAILLAASCVGRGNASSQDLGSNMSQPSLVFATNMGKVELQDNLRSMSTLRSADKHT